MAPQIRMTILVILVAVLVLLGCRAATATQARDVGPQAAQSAPNVIFIMVDSLRSDHVSAYGYGRDTTPNLDAWVAAQGVRFTEATAPSSWTYPTNAAILTSHTPSSIDVVYGDMNGRLPEAETLLAEYLHEAGYATAGFVSAFWVWERFGFNQGFDHYVHTRGDRADEVNQLAMTWLDDNWTAVQAAGKPLFLYLYYFDPHTYYDAPPPYDTLYDSTYTGTLTAAAYAHGEPVVSGVIVPTARDVEHLIALYDGEIRYWDEQMGQMFAYLDGLGVLDNSVIVVTSDHGQMFGEHGKWVHRNSLYEEVLRVPLLLRYPGVVTADTAVSAPVQGMDITPTILDLLNLPVPDHMQGDSLVPLLQGDTWPADRPIYSEMDSVTDPAHPAYWIAPRTDLFAVKQAGWKYVHALGGRSDDLLLQVGDSSVYEGPNEIAAEPEKAAALYDDLVRRFNLPTEFLFLPSVD